ncbi:hypothetical protein GGU45_004079 [Niabella hirudinis]
MNLKHYENIATVLLIVIVVVFIFLKANHII